MIRSCRIGFSVLGMCFHRCLTSPPSALLPQLKSRLAPLPNRLNPPRPMLPPSRYRLCCEPILSTCDPQPETDTAAFTLHYSCPINSFKPYLAWLSALWPCNKHLLIVIRSLFQSELKLMVVIYFYPILILQVLTLLKQLWE